MTQNQSLITLQGLLSKGDTVTLVRIKPPTSKGGRPHFLVLWPEAGSPIRLPTIKDITPYVAAALGIDRAKDGGIACADQDTMIAGLAIGMGWEYNDLKVTAIAYAG
jgi:hypothetical protein